MASTTMKIQYIAKQISEDGLVKPVFARKYVPHKIPLDETFDSPEEAINYLKKELDHNELVDIRYGNNVVILPVIVPEYKV